MIGQRIKELREEKGMTQATLAEQTQININTLAAYERETREPNIEKISLFADYFNVTTDYLIGKSQFMNDDEADATREQISAIETLLINLPASIRHDVLTALESFIQESQNSNEEHNIFVLRSFSNIVKVYTNIHKIYFDMLAKAKTDRETSNEWNQRIFEQFGYTAMELQSKLYKQSLADDCAAIRAELDNLCKALPLIFEREAKA